MTMRILMTIVFIAVLAYADLSAGKTEPFAAANEFPRGALVYVQVADLPGFIHIWNDSELRAKYLGSDNFNELVERHLGLKLASRWQEFNDAAGFQFNLEAVAGMSTTGASLAVYDIGRLDLVFIAPVSDEIYSATLLMQNSDHFEQEVVDGDITVYRAKVDADRGRQKQDLLFTNYKNRLIVATNEVLLVRTISNLKGNSHKDSLADEPSFAELKARVSPHVATVWVDQTKLSADYYFKRYWLMGQPGRLKNVVAGMFDLDLANGGLTEHREFLLDTIEPHALITQAEQRQALSHLPENVPLFELRATAGGTVDMAIKTLISGVDLPKDRGDKKREFRYSSSAFDSDSDDDYDGGDSGSVDEDISEDDDADQSELPAENTTIDLSMIAAASPKYILTMARPEMRPIPLFFECKRAVVVHLDEPGRFARETFEAAIEKAFSQQLTAGTGHIAFSWETKNGAGGNIRTLALPLTGRGFSYSIVGNDLFAANDEDFLSEVETADKIDHGSNASISEMAVLDINKAEPQFRDVFGRLTPNKTAKDFFTGNVASLIDLWPQNAQLEITRTYAQDRLTEYLRIGGE